MGQAAQKNYVVVGMTAGVIVNFQRLHIEQVLALIAKVVEVVIAAEMVAEVVAEVVVVAVAVAVVKDAQILEVVAVVAVAREKLIRTTVS